MAPPALGPATGGATRPLETDDMQGLVRRAYGDLAFSRYLLLGIGEPAAARAWLGVLAGDVTTAGESADDLQAPCLNVAFTGTGLAQLGLAPDDVAALARPLREGMVTEHRSRILGDSGANAPEAWRWGGAPQSAVHVVVMVFAHTGEELNEACLARRSVFEADGALVEVAEPIDGRLLPDPGREHFGYVDGLSQPVLRGWPHGRRSQNPSTDAQPPKWSEISPGEIVFGYEDNFGHPSEGPTVAATTDPNSWLPPWGATGRRHLGHNGTFLVLRQLAQDVAAFRGFVESAEGPDNADLVRAKLVGRWPNGAPLAGPEPTEHAALSRANDFGYHDQDQFGLRCPIGAHIRRANPRDSSKDAPDKALASTKNHRILRRGRPYGLPLVAGSTEPGEQAGAERGLVFVCLNADIERQFEFVQHTWLTNPYFAGLYDEVDPLVGGPPPAGGAFTWPAGPVRRKLTGLTSVVTVKGGAYLFLPGVRALRYLAAVQP